MSPAVSRPAPRWISLALLLLAAATGLLALSYLAYALLPYSLLRSVADRLASDGSAEGYTQQLYQSMRAGAIVSLLSAAILSVSLWKLRSRTADLAFLTEWRIPGVMAAFRREGALACSVLAALVATGAGLRVWLMDLPLRYDEAFTYLLTRKGLANTLTDYSFPNNHILHTLMVFVSTWILGGSEWAIRIPALLTGCGLCVLIYFTARRLFASKEAGILCAALAAIAPGLAGYSANARGYELQAVFGLVLVWAAVWWAESRSREAAVWFTTAGALSLYLLPTSIYLMICASVVFLLESDRKGTPPTIAELADRVRVLALSGFYAVVIALFFYSPALVRCGPQALFANRFVQHTQDRLGNLTGSMTEAARFATAGWPLALTGIVLMGVALAVVRRPVARRLLAGLMVIPILALAQGGNPPARVWLFLTPLVLLLAGAGLASVLRGSLAYVAAALIAITGSISLTQPTTRATVDALMDGLPKGRELSGIIAAQAAPSDAVFIDVSWGPSLRYYSARAGKRLIFDPDAGGKPKRLFVVCNQPACSWEMVSRADPRMPGAAAAWNGGELPQLSGNYQIASTPAYGVYLIPLRAASGR